MNEIKKIEICCPVYNEEENIEDFFVAYTKITQAHKGKYIFSFLFSDNCSTDNSFNIIKTIASNNNNVSGIRYSRNFGVMKSIYTAIIESKSDCDAIAVFDCDLQDPPELLNKFIKEYENGFKVIYGKRIDRDEPYLMRFLRKCYKKIEAILQKNPSNLESGAWFLDKAIVEEITKNQYYQPYLSGLINNIGFKKTGVEYERLKRKKGITKFSYISYFLYAIDGIVGGSIVPLRISIFVGLIFGLLAIFLAIYFIIAKLFLGIDFAEGVAAIIILLLFNFAVNFFFLGIIGEYVGRIFKKEEDSLPAIIEERI